MATENKYSGTLIDALSEFFSGNATLKVDVGISPDSAIKIAVIAIVTTIVCVLIAKAIK